jgi:hypothetical protein
MQNSFFIHSSWEWTWCPILVANPCLRRSENKIFTKTFGPKALSSFLHWAYIRSTTMVRVARLGVDYEKLRWDSWNKKSVQHFYDVTTWETDKETGRWHLMWLLQRWTVTVAALSKAWTVIARSNAGIVGSNPAQGMDVWCVYTIILCLCCPVFR